MSTVELAETKAFAPAVLSYTNYRGEVSVRRIIPHRAYFGATEWHPEPQWLLSGYDVDKGAVRDFALKDFGLSIDRNKLVDMIAELLSGSYDCTRVWDAWRHGTMTADDFAPVENRADEIADAILLTLQASPTRAPVIPRLPEIDIHAEVEGYEWRGDGDYTPNDREKALLEDFGNGLIGVIEERLGIAGKVSRSACTADLGQSLINEGHARYAHLPPLHLTRAEFDALDEYSATLPTGTTPGKRWKRHDGAFDKACEEPFWLIGEYDPEDDGKGTTIKVNWYVPVIRLDTPLSGGSI